MITTLIPLKPIIYTDIHQRLISLMKM